MIRKLKPRKDEVTITMDISEWETLRNVLKDYIYKRDLTPKKDSNFAKELYQLPLTK